MDWVTVSNKKNGQVYINGDFELLPDGAVKFTPKTNIFSKNGKYNIQDYFYDLSQSENGLLAITLEELKSIGVETQKLLNEKKISEKINLLELCKLANLSKQNKIELDKLIILSKDLDLNDIFRKYWTANNYELK